MDDSLTMSAQRYQCIPCSERLGRDVRSLVRMVPVAMIMDGEMVGSEFYCCPECGEPKFDVRSKKAVKPRKPKSAPSRPALRLVDDT